jgi:hypothetical protein
MNTNTADLGRPQPHGRITSTTTSSTFIITYVTLSSLFSALTRSLRSENTNCIVFTAFMAHLFDQPNVNETVTWQPESNLRGTFSIFSTCTITIILGVWSVVHLNLPRIDWEDAFTRRLLWAICSVFVPESSVMIAWSQQKAASRVQKKVEEIFDTLASASVSLNTS